jgi:hypothetical protein
MSKVMICCPTYAKSAPVAQYLLQGLASQTHADLNFVFLDTTSAATPGKIYEQLPSLLQRYLEGRMTTILKTTTPAGASANQIITEAREQLRQYFLSSNAEYLFFVDDDVELPADAIEKLLSHKKQVMVGVYLNPMILRDGELPEIAPCLWVAIPGSKEVVRPLQIIDVMPSRIIPVAMSGFGCALLHRSVMDIPFVFDPASTTTEDTPFFLALAQRKILALCDTRVKCKHYKYHALDERNKQLDLARYKLQYVP